MSIMVQEYGSRLTSSSYELPEDLFDKSAGEAKPTKPQKKKTLLKRTLAEIEVSIPIGLTRLVY